MMRKNLLDRVFGKLSEQMIHDGKKYGAKADDVLDSLIALWSAQRIQLGQAEAIIGGEEEYKPTEIILGLKAPACTCSPR